MEYGQTLHHFNENEKMSKEYDALRLEPEEMKFYMLDNLSLLTFTRKKIFYNISLMYHFHYLMLDNFLLTFPRNLNFYISNNILQCLHFYTEQTIVPAVGGY